MNQVLFWSSFITAGITCFFIKYTTNRIIVVVYISSTLTSLWNHGTTSRIAKISDRTMQVVGALVYLYHKPSLLSLFFWMYSMICFIISKRFNLLEYHMYSHVYASLLHITMF